MGLLLTEFVVAGRKGAFFMTGVFVLLKCCWDFVRGRYFSRAVSAGSGRPIGAKVADVKARRILLAAAECSFDSGAFRSLLALTVELRKMGNFVFVVVPRGGSGEKLLIDNGIPYEIVCSLSWIVPIGSGRRSYREMAGVFIINHLAISKITKLIRREKIDLVHVNSAPTYVGAFAALDAKVPLVWHLRDYLEEDHGRVIYNKAAGYDLMRKAVRCIAVSQGVYDKYATILGEDRIVKIFNGIDPERFYHPAHVIMEQRIVRLVLMGPLSAHKGQYELTCACAALYKSGIRDFELWFVGCDDGAMRSAVDSIIEESGLKGRVLFWGRQEHPEDILKDADVAFMCSRCEAFGRATVEAMLAGCLVVGADTGATPELVRNGETGFLFHFEQGKCDDLVKKIKYVLENRDLVRAVAQAGQRYALENMTAERNAREIAELYRNVLGAA